MARITIKDEWLEGARNLPDSARAEVLGAIVLYMMDGEFPEVSKRANDYLVFTKPSIDAFRNMASRMRESRKRFDQGDTTLPPTCQEGVKEVADTCHQDDTSVPPREGGDGFPAPYPYPEEKKKREYKYSPKKEKPFDLSIVTPEYMDAIQTWIAYRRDIKKPYKSQSSFEAFYRKLVKDTENNPATAMEWIEFSMANGYQGLFAPKNSVGPNRIPRAMDVFEDEARKIQEMMR